MRTVDIIRRAGRSLREAKIRTLLTSLAIAVGAFTVTLSLAAGAGTRQYTDRLIRSNVDPQLLMVGKDKKLFNTNGMSSSPESQTGLQEYNDGQVSQRGISYETLSRHDLQKIAQIDGVDSMEPFVSPEVKYVSFEGSSKKYTVSVKMYAGLMMDVAAGSLPVRGQTLGGHDIVIPESFLKTIGYPSAKDALHKTVTLAFDQAGTQVSQDQIMAAYQQGGAGAVATLSRTTTAQRTFKIVAVTKTSPMAIMESSDSLLQISPAAARDIAHSSTGGQDDGRSLIAIGAAKKGVDPKSVKQRIEQAGYVAQTAEDLQGMIFIIVNVLQSIVIGFGILALIASVFGIINTQYISVLERTQQIGLMKALGMRRKYVSKLFRYEAAWIGFLGGVIGAGLAYAAGTILNPWIAKTLKLGDGNYLLVFEPLPIIALVVALVFVAIIAGYFPARKAAKLDPIEALRTE